MAWPTKTWTVNGWEDFKTPGIGPPEGLPDDWRDHRGGVLGDSISYWEAINNPLYEAAANASGIDWDRFVTESMAEIGAEEDYEDYEDDRERVFKNVKLDEKWSSMSNAQRRIASGLPEFRMAERYDEDKDPYHGYTKYKDDRHDWGIDRGRFGSIADDLDTMHEWLGKTIKTHALQDMPIIDRGPQGSDYGIDGDIWVHYGLDKPPKPPKAMDVNYEFNLIAAKPSTTTYATPAGFPVLDKSTESVPYGSTHYARWTAQKEQEAQAAQTEYDTTSYGEPT